MAARARHFGWSLARRLLEISAAVKRVTVTLRAVACFAVNATTSIAS